MRRDVVCFYADLGKRGYIDLMRRMTESAKAVMPDCRTVLMTTSDDEELRSIFDVRALLDFEVSESNLCATRARSTVTWQLEQADGITFHVDPDIVFQREPEIDPRADVMMCWRKRPDQPVNSGLVIAKPGCREFWQAYGKAAVALPKPLDGWWCDQLAYNLLVGTSHKAGDYVWSFGALVTLIDADLMCAKPNEAREDTWTVHYKGQRKWKLPREKSGDGKLLPDCASSMVTEMAQS